MPRHESPAREGRRSRLRPSPERLEARELLAVAGSLDPTFGLGKGYTETSFDPATTTGLTTYSAAVVEPDGSILVDGPVGASGRTFGLIHFKANGTPDTAFGVGGETDVVLPAGLTPTGPPTSLLQQADGKILVVGIVQTSDATPKPVTIVARFDVGGGIDSRFGTDGVLALDQATVGTPGATLPYASLQVDGKLVLAGTGTLAPTTQIISVRLTPLGTLDPGYGTAGLVTVSDLSDVQRASPTSATQESDGLAIQPDGKIVILADVSLINSLSFRQVIPELIRINTDGSRDLSINQNGLLASAVYTPSQHGLIIQSDGKYLVLGRSSDYQIVVVARLNQNGSFDKQAGPFSRSPTPNSFALQPDGKILLTGGLEYQVSTDPVVDAEKTFVAFRLTTDLDPDPSFGQGGTVVIPIPDSSPPPGLNVNPPSARVITVGANDKPVVLGSSFSTPTDEVVIARLIASPTPTKAVAGDFNADGVADPAIYLPAYGAFAIGDSTGATTGRIALFGTPGPGQTIPTEGDYDGSPNEEIGGYLVAQGLYAYRPSNGGPDVVVSFGTPGPGESIPVPADYYGTGVDDIAVYLAASACFAIKDPTGQTAGAIIPFGMPGVGNSIPVPGDYDGSGHTELAVYVPSMGAFIYRPANGGADVVTYFGTPGAGNSLPVPGDYTGSGHDEFAVYLPNLGGFAYRPPGQADVFVPFGTPGVGQSLPAPGDYTGSGHEELGVYLPALGLLAYRPAVGGPDVYDRFGFPGPGQTVPVTRVVLSPFPGSGQDSGDAFGLANFVGGLGPLDLIATKKPKSGLHPG